MGLHVVLITSTEGLEIVGPFKHSMAAVEWAEERLDHYNWLVLPLLSGE